MIHTPSLLGSNMEVTVGAGNVKLSVLVITTWIITTVGAQPNVSGAPWVDVGMSTTLQCAPTSAGILRLLQWRNSSFDVTDYTLSEIFIRFTISSDSVLNRDPAHYAFDKDDPSYPLTINTVTLDDEARYWCNVDTATGVKQGLLDVRIRVPPSTMAVSYDGTSYSDGSTFPIVAGSNRQFTCTTPGVKPAANFTWTLPTSITTDQPLGSQTDTSNSSDSRLTDSSNTITVDIAETPATAQLTCGATNRQDGLTDNEIDLTVTIEVKVTPKAVKLSDADGDKVEGATVTVDQGSSHTFSCVVQGTRPAATIQWFLDDAMQSAGVVTPPPAESNELFDATSSWSFTPARVHHRQTVKCEASSTDWRQQYASVTVTLDVNGPPNDPEITGDTSMTEDVASPLTCTAQEGYPQEWGLVWYNVSSTGESEIPGATPDTPMLINNRFTFTSMLNYTPSRHDNGNSIKCTAQWNSLTPQPQSTFGPLNVQFCARSLRLTQSAATAGSTVTLSCVTSESSNPATFLTWFKDSVPLTTPTDQTNSSGDNGGRVTTVIYTTDVLDKNNNGDVYRCCATNPTIASCVTPLCDNHTLNVRYPPDFTSLTQTPQTPVTEGSDLTLTCTVDANPSTVDTTWKKNDQGDSFNPTNGVTSTLTLSNIKREDAGYYTCTANNGVPTDNPTDVVSSLITVIVNYEVNITNKAMNEVGVKHGDTAVLTCIAVGNPQPVIEWYGPNTTGLISDTDEGKFLITNKTSGGDRVFGFEVTSKLTIKAVDSQVDYGVYTCISSNGIGREDLLNITLTGTRRPDKPTRVEITEQTAESLTVTWTPGYDGGAEQSFRVSYIKTSDSSTEVFTEETGGKTTSTATGLNDYTEYEIRVYAKNAIGESIGYGNTMGYTLPAAPGPDSGITVEFNKDEGTVKVEGLEENACIQLEVQYQGNDTWHECGACIFLDQTVTLSEWCASSQKRRRRAVRVIEAVRSKKCFGVLCSEPADADIVTTDVPLDIGLIVGASVGGGILAAIIVVLVVYLVRTSPKRRSGKEDSLSCANEVELQETSHDAQPEENSGITNEALLNNVDEEIPKKKPEKNEEPDAEPTEEDGLEADTTKGPIPVKRYTVDSGDTYAQVNKIKLPPKPESARSAPTNLPDVTYAEVNKDKKPKPPHDDYAAKKKPKKYVPPSSRAAEESAYEEVQISDKDKAKIPPAADSADTYASVGGQQDTSGRVVTEDGLIYAEVGHMKQHPVDQPPIQTEESTEYASLDFARMKPEDK